MIRVGFISGRSGFKDPKFRAFVGKGVYQPSTSEQSLHCSSTVRLSGLYHFYACVLERLCTYVCDLCARE